MSWRWPGWSDGERPVIPPDLVACTRCGRPLTSVMRFDHFAGSGERQYSWTLRCPSWLGTWVGHDEFRLLPHRNPVEVGYSDWSGPRPVYVEIAA